MTYQETEGVLSPWIRSIRLRKVAALIPDGSGVLDLACGAGFLRDWLPPHCKYFGVDRVQPLQLERFTDFLLKDLCDPDLIEVLTEWLLEPVDILTLVAFIEHIQDPQILLKNVQPLLKPNGTVILTTPHPVGRSLHDALASIYLCSRAGAEEHEDFFSQADLEQLATLSGLTLTHYDRFLYGLNQLIVMKRET